MTQATVIELGGNPRRLIVSIDPSPPPQVDARIESRWQELCAQNPRLFNGRILAFLRADLVASCVYVQVDQYKRMATQTPENPVLIQFGVTGILTASQYLGSNQPEEVVLLGKRSAETHIYPGQWELAPSGGVDAPPDGTTTMSVTDIARQVEQELAEETGLDAAHATIEPIALCNDPIAPSLDVVFRVHLDTPSPVHTSTWEYDELRWIPVRNLARHLEHNAIELIPPSAAVTRWLGWR